MLVPLADSSDWSLVQSGPVLFVTLCSMRPVYVQTAQSPFGSSAREVGSPFHLRKAAAARLCR